ncbi:hypothetical protein Tco_1225145 [Tanacetum coccineum]
MKRGEWDHGKGNTTDSTMEKHTPKTSALDVKTSADCVRIPLYMFKLFDIEVMQREIDEELKAERLNNLMAWNWDAFIDLSEDVVIVIDDEFDVEVDDYMESFVIKDTQGDTIDDNKQHAKRARKDELYSFPLKKITSCLLPKRQTKNKQQVCSLYQHVV